MKQSCLFSLCFYGTAPSNNRVRVSRLSITVDRILCKSNFKMAEIDDLIPLDDDIDINNYRSRLQEYCGHYDSNGLRSGHGCQTWITDHYEKYEGNFLLDNMHGSGVYITKIGSKRTICSGKFYCNDLEGYAEIIYRNGIFEGLFNNNRRFGPGILTYVDGSQDVGLWFDQTLIRLSCVVLPNWMPVFGRTVAAKTYLLQFRKLVPVVPETIEDKATQILKGLDASEEVLKNAYKLYNPYIRNRNSSFFNRSLYDEVFFENKHCYIEVAVCENDEEIYTDKIEEELSQCDCTCKDPNNLRKDEIFKSIQVVDNKLFNLLEKIKMDELEESGSAVDLLSTDGTKFTQKIDSYKAQVEALMTFKDTLKAKLLTDNTEKIEEPLSTTKVLVTELLAWNNEKMFMKMLQHCFLHKSTESNMSFDVTKLLAGERHDFNRSGKHERVCIEFLTKCSEGKAYEISDILRKHNLNPDLCDANGNTGVTFAVARDKVLVVKALTNNGANLDSVNDEGLTPLTLCMARYLAVQYGINDWERGFLPEMDRVEEEAFDWYCTGESHRVSFVDDDDIKYTKSTFRSLTEIADRAKSILSKEMFANLEGEEQGVAQASLTDLTRILKIFTMTPGMQEFQLPYQHQPDREQTYIFNTACVRLMEKPTLKQIQDAGRRKSSILLGEIVISDEDEEATDERKVIADKLEVVRRTMLCLLHYGADPDIGYVPFPALVMAVFTQSADIVEQLLENNADPNITTLGENMTPIHTVASLQPSRELIEVGEVLLRYKANPNCRASPTHWLLLNASILGHGFENELPDTGKTPLHLLCMRYDFINDDSNYFENLAKLLLRNGANGNDMFLGHSPLSLAVVRGNISLVETLLDLGCVDPNQKLGRGMGVPLTVLILKRYADVLYFDVCKLILDTLLDGRANPFEPIFDYGNAIDFMQRKHEARLKAEREQAQKEIEAESFDDRKKKIKKEKEEEREREAESGIIKGRRKAKITDQVLMQNYLLQRSREVLFKRIQCQSTKLLYEFMDEYIPVNDIMEIVRYLTPEDVCSSMELLLREGEMSFEDLHFDTLYRLTHFVANVTKRTHGRKRSAPNTEENSKADYIQTAKRTLEILREMDINERPKFQGAVHPSVDPDEDKYKVCFYCCRKKGRELYKCPKCEMIYFCSELCNRLCNKTKLKHVCGLVFYKSQKALHDQMKAADVETKLSKKISMVMSKKSERIIALEEERKKEKLKKKLRYTKIKSRKSLDLKRRRQSFMCQRKLDQYVDIMNMHIEKLETLEDEGHGSVISLTQVAKDITEIATQINLPAASRQSLSLGVIKPISSKMFSSSTSVSKDMSEMEYQKRASGPAEKFGAPRTKPSAAYYQRMKSDDRRESVSFAGIPSIKVINQKSRGSKDTRRYSPERMEVIYQTDPSKATAVDSTSTSLIYLKSSAKKKKSQKSLLRTSASSDGKNFFHTIKQDTKRKEKLWATSIKRESTCVKVFNKSEEVDTTMTAITTTTTKSLTPPPSASPKKKIKKSLLSRVKTPRKTIAESTRGAMEEPKQEVTDKEPQRKNDEKSSKNDKFAHYWFHKTFIKRLANIFPTLDLRKLLLPFACFAEGQLYYRFGNNGSTVYKNYSKL